MDEETKRLVERVEELLPKISAGPWERWKGGDGCSVMQGPSRHNTSTEYRGSVAFDDGRIAECDIVDKPTTRARANAAFIAESRMLVPALRDALLKLDAEREAWQVYAVAVRQGYVETNNCPGYDRCPGSEVCGNAKCSVDKAKAALIGLGVSPDNL